MQNKFENEEYKLNVIAAAFAHDFRSPINNLLINVGILHGEIISFDHPENMPIELSGLLSMLTELEHLAECFFKLIKQKYREIANKKHVSEIYLINLQSIIQIETDTIIRETERVQAQILSLRSKDEFEFLRTEGNKTRYNRLSKCSERSNTLMKGLGAVLRLGQENKDNSEFVKLSNQFKSVISLSANLINSEDQRIDFRNSIFTFETDDAKIYAQPSYLRILISNLIENACRYAIPQDNIVISYGARKTNFNILKQLYTDKLKKYTGSGDWVEVHVVNSHGGKPIPKNKSEQIFDLFSTENRGGFDEKMGGGGVGLALCRLICYLHNGVIFVNYRDPNVTDMTILLPVSRKDGISKKKLIRHERINRFYNE